MLVEANGFAALHNRASEDSKLAEEQAARKLFVGVYLSPIDSGAGIRRLAIAW